MPVDSTHRDYDALQPEWKTMRDASGGERPVKAEGTIYLPMLGGQDEDEYGAFKTRASFFGATGRTIDGLSGMIFRKPPTLDVPEGMEDFMEDVTLAGVNFQGFAEMAVDEVLKVGRGGILVDYPRVEAGDLTQAEADRMNLRPYFGYYKAEAIIDWRVGRVGNKTVLTQVRLLEDATEDGGDEFKTETVEQIRVLDLDDTGKYRQRVFRRENASDEKKSKWAQYGNDIYPKVNGQMFDSILFIFLGTRDTTPHCDKPPLIDLADKNFDHYRQDADYKHALHFIAAGMTRWVKGVHQKEIDDGNFDTVGPSALLASTSPDAEFGITEPTGNGLPAQRQALQDTEQQMAVLGARMLSPEKRQVEAAETAAIHRQGESSSLSSLAMSVSSALKKALEIARDWMSLKGDIMVALNTDYVATGMNAAELVAYTKVLQEGGISLTSFIEALQRGEALRPDLTVEDELKRLQDDQFNPLPNKA